VYELEIYLFTIILLIFILILPRLERIRFKDMEFDLNQAPDLDLGPKIGPAPPSSVTVPYSKPESNRFTNII